MKNVLRENIVCEA